MDAIFFEGHREVSLDAAQKEELLQFVRDGHGFVAAHVGLTAFESWPEFGELLGARFDGHPIVGDGVVVNENLGFPATKHFPAAFAFNDEFYQPSQFSRSKIDVLLRLDVIFRILRSFQRHLGHPQRPADVLRSHAVGAGLDGWRACTASAARERGYPRGPRPRRRAITSTKLQRLCSSSNSPTRRTSRKSTRT